MIIALRKENERLLSFPPGSDSQLITFFFPKIRVWVSAVVRGQATEKQLCTKDRNGGSEVRVGSEEETGERMPSYSF